MNGDSTPGGEAMRTHALVMFSPGTKESVTLTLSGSPRNDSTRALPMPTAPAWVAANPASSNVAAPTPFTKLRTLFIPRKVYEAHGAMQHGRLCTIIVTRPIAINLPKVRV